MTTRAWRALRLDERSTGAILATGAFLGVLAWLALLVLLLMRERPPSAFSVFYNLPISVTFSALAAHLVASLVRAPASYAREHYPLLIAWGLGGVLLFLRLVVKTTEVSGHATWSILMAAQAEAYQLPVVFRCIAWAVVLQVLLLKWLVLGGSSGLLGLAAGSALGCGLWLARRITASRAVH